MVKSLLIISLLLGQAQILAQKPVNPNLNYKVLRLAREGDVKFFQELFSGEEIPDVNCRGRLGYTPLMFAAERGQTQLVEILVDNGALLNLQNETGQTAFIIAAEKGNNSTLEFLFDAGADINIRDNDGRTALSVAIHNDKYDAATLLVEFKVDLNAQDKDGNTALIKTLRHHFSTPYESSFGFVWTEFDAKASNAKYYYPAEKLAELIIQAGANLAIHNNEGITARMKVAGYESYHYTTVRKLLENTL